MTTVRINTSKEKVTLINNEVILDSRITFAARGLYCFIACIESIYKHGLNEEDLKYHDQLYSPQNGPLEELIRFGYIERESE